MPSHTRKDFAGLAIIVGMTILTGAFLMSSTVKADDSVVDVVNVTVPVSCTLSGTGMNSHTAEISNGSYQANIGTTTLKAFCNDNNGFAIYAAGYTGNEIGGTNSNKLVGTSASGNATIVTGLATSTPNPDVSNWAMKLTATGDSGDTTGTNALTIDSAPNTSGGANASFSQYHTVPNEYTKVAHKNTSTDMNSATGGATLTTTYAAYISETQPADTYTGQVIYTLVHPANADTPVASDQIGVNYLGNGQTFAGGATKNRVVYGTTCTPMHIATTPEIVETSNLTNGVYGGPYTDSESEFYSHTYTGASKVKVEVDYGFTGGTAELLVIDEAWDGDWENYDDNWDDDWLYSEDNISGTKTYILDGNTVTVYGEAWNTPENDYDYGFYVRVYPLYTTAQTDTEEAAVCGAYTTQTGTYAETTQFSGLWHIGDGNNRTYFTNESQILDYLEQNGTPLLGTTINIYATEIVLQDVAVWRGLLSQGQQFKATDIRDGQTYVVARLNDNNIWMLSNLALDPTDSTTASNMDETNTNATAAAITNYLNGGNVNNVAGWSNTAVTNASSWSDSYTEPLIDNTYKETLVTSYGPAATNGQAKVGIYYNYCSATIGTYCYAYDTGADASGTLIDAPQDICPANWRMPTGGYKSGSEYRALLNEYSTTMVASETDSLQYNLSTPLSGLSGGYGQNSRGAWWSSTIVGVSGSSARQAHALTVEPDYVSTSGDLNYNRSEGFTIRCLTQ